MTKRVQRKLASFLLIVQLFFSFFAPFSPFIGRLTAQDQSSPANFSEFNTESLEFDYKDGQLIVDSNQQQLDYSYYYLHQDVTQAEQGRLSFGENSLFVGTESNGHFIDHDFELMIFKAQRGGKTYAHYLQKQDTELEVLQVVGSDDLELSDDELDWLENYEVQELSAETLSTVSTQKSVEWEVDETSQTAVTKDNVRLNVEYIFPLEEAVTVTFTKLPAEEADRSNLRIARVRVDELNLPDDFKTDAEHAYDITTEMENGTFEYDLSLPKTGQKDDEVSYIEKSIDEVKAGVGEHDIKKVEQSKIKAQDEVVKVTALDHLTLFIAGGGAEMRVTGSLDGQAQVTVNPGQSIRVDLEVSGGSGDVWRSSSWQVQGESLNCVDHQDHDVSSGSANQSFDITAPGSNGTYDVSFAAYTGDTCDSGASNTFTLTDGIIVDSGYTIPEVSYTYDAGDPIAFKSVTGVWTSVNGGSNVTGVNTEEVRWGTSAGYGQSGLRFDGSGLQSFDTGDTFYLGALTHFNFPIYNAADGATLKITLEFEKPDVSPNPEFSFYFEINETPNVAGECPEWQISDTPCDDMITFPSIDETKSFEIEDRLYTLKIEGFVDSYPDGDPVQHFITEENLASTAFLVGSLSSVLIEEPGISIKKKTNNIDVTGAPGPELYVGDTVTWQYIVQNIGNVKLTDINVTDDQEGGVTCPKTTLQPGEDMTCEITDGVVTVGQYENKATVVADHSSGTVTGEDTSWYFGVYHKGSIKIVKNTTGGDDTFNFTSNFGVSSLTTVDGTASQTISDLIAGSSYSISETVPTGWSLDSASCDRGTINAIEVVHGQTTTCTFENTKLDPVIQVVKSSTTTSITTAGQVVPYTFTVTNEGNTTLTGITVTDPNCDAVPVYQSGDTNTNENLDVNETWIYTCSHTVTQGEIDTGGNLVNEVTVDSNETEPVTDDHFIPITQSPALSIVKSGKFNDKNADGYADVGETISYTFSVTNDGNVTLTNVTVTDPLVTVTGGPTTLDVGETDTTTFTASYTITQADIDAGKVDNTATADSVESSPATDDEIVTLSQDAKLSIDKTATPSTYDSVGDVITYEFLVTNTGNLTLYDIYVVDDKAIDESCPDTNGGLAPNDQITCTASYTIDQADLNNGFVTNIAYATDGTTNSPEDTEIVTAEQLPALSIDKTATPSTYDSVGDVITYEFLVTNTGNLTLYDIYVVDDKAIDESCPDTNGGLAPNDQITCTASYTIDQADLNNGFVTNIAYATDGDIESARDSATVTSIAGRIIIEKQTLPDGSSQLFEFNPSWIEDNFSLSDGQSEDSGWLAPGQYTVEEIVPAGWDLTDISCSEDGEENSSIIESGADLILEAGETITCTFTNTQRAQVRVHKFDDEYISGQFDDGDELLAGWDMTIISQADEFSQTETTQMNNGSYAPAAFSLIPGDYTLSETLQDGWEQSAMYCELLAVGQVPFINQVLGINQVLAQEVSEEVEVEESQQQSDSIDLTVNPGDNINCYVGNYQLGSIYGDKYFDADQDGQYDGGEITLSDWEITLIDGEDQLITQTDANGRYSFENLTAGTYTVCEQDRTAEGWQATEPSGQLCREVVINQSGQQAPANFGNYINSLLLIEKTNNVWPNDQETGDEVTYTIQIMADEGPVYGVRVFDLLPEQFEYIAGSFTAKSSTGADLKANGITTEPNYASPGVWELGDLVKDEIVTLTYRAVIGDDIDPGIYPDMVWALGTSAEDYVANQETTDNLLALSDPNFTASVEGVDFDGSQGHYGEDYFAGTQVAVVTDQTPSSRYQIERTEEKEGEVLGTATELPATGARFWLTILAFFSILSGAGLLLWPKFARRFSGKLLLIAAALGTSLFMAQSVHALSSVRLGEPYNASDQFNQDAITNQTDFKIDFVVLNTDNLSVEAQCQQRQDGGSWSDITTSYTVKAGGNSGICEVSGLSNQSQYDFRVRVTGDGDPEYSNLVRVDLDTDKPKQPVSYKKTKDGDCAYEIEFKTADDDRTTRVEVYRTSNSERLSANADTRIADISIGPDETHVFSTSKPNCDKDYYYAIRAFDQYNNASDLIGDKEIVTIIVEPSEETIAAAEAEAAMELAALPVSDVGAADVFLIPDEEMVDEEMPDDEVDEDMEEVTLETEEEEVEGQVLGEAVETFWSVLRRWALPLGIGIIILLAVYFLFIAKKNEK